MDEIVGVVTVMFAAVKLEHAHPLRQATIGYGALRCLRPVTGLQLKNGFIQRAGASGNGVNQAR